MPEAGVEAHFDLTGLAVVVAAAVLCGLGLKALKQPPIVGYILAGVLLGPTGLGLVHNSTTLSGLAELGVVLLLFLIGMELSLRAFVRVLWPAMLTVAGQIGIALGLAFLAGWLLSWPANQSILIAFIIAISSTAVAIKMLEDIDELRTPIGQITIGVLIGQDIVVIPMLIFAESMGAGGVDWTVGLKAVFALVFVVAVIRVLSTRGKIRLPFAEAVRGNVDLLALGSLAACFGAAAFSGLLGLSAAYGAFIAGLVIANTTLRVEAIEVTEPIQSVLIFVFFLSIGLLIDLDYIWSNLALVLAFTVAVLTIKSVVNIALLHLVREPWERAFPAGLIMAQIGEFSFVLAAIGFKNGALDFDGYRLALTIIAMSLLLSPFWMANVRRFHDIASGGITDFRQTLAEVYSVELEELARGRNLVYRVGHRSLVRARAARHAWLRHRRERQQGMKDGVRSAAAPSRESHSPPADDLEARRADLDRRLESSREALASRAAGSSAVGSGADAEEGVGGAPADHRG